MLDMRKRCCEWVAVLLLAGIGCSGTGDNLLPSQDVNDHDDVAFDQAGAVDDLGPAAPDTSSGSVQLPTGPVAMLTNRDFLPIVIKVLAEAKTEISIAHLEFLTGNGPNQVAAQLQAAAARGVTVHVILDHDVDENPARISEFSAEGIQAKLGGTNRTLHVKLVVVDRTTVLVGSTNFSTSSMLYNNEANWYFKGTAIGDAFADYAEGLFASDSGVRSIPKGPFAGVTLIGDGDYPDRVLPVLAAAKKRVRLVMYDMAYESATSSDSGNMVRSLIAAKNRGVDTRVILELSDFDTNVNSDNQTSRAVLENAGVSVRQDSTDITTHAKLLVADDTVVIYSGNWIYSGMSKNHEAGAIYTDATIATQAVGYFDTVWATCN